MYAFAPEKPPGGEKNLFSHPMNFCESTNTGQKTRTLAYLDVECQLFYDRDGFAIVAFLGFQIISRSASRVKLANMAISMAKPVNKPK